MVNQWIKFWLVSDRYITVVSFYVRQSKEFKVVKCLVNIFVLILIEKCVVQSILVEANLFLAIQSQPDLIIRAILQVASI